MRGHTQIQQLIAGWAIDADEPDPAAHRELVDHLATCEDCRILYTDLSAVSGDLALAAEPVAPSAGLEDRIVGAATTDDTLPKPAGRRRPQRFLVVVAAAFLVVAGLGATTIRLATTLGDERARADRLERAVALLNGASTVTLNPGEGAAGQVTVAVADDGRALLLGSGLEVPPGKLMEIWLVRGSNLVPSEVFVPEEGTALVEFAVEPKRDIGIALTIEDERVEEPTTTPVFQGSLNA